MSHAFAYVFIKSLTESQSRRGPNLDSAAFFHRGAGHEEKGPRILTNEDFPRYSLLE
jgi:hypothetical protein